MTRFCRLTIIGVGLIGGSLARAVRGACSEIVGCGRSPEHLSRAVELSVIDRYTTDVAEAVSGADMVVVAVPLLSMAAVFSAMREALAAEAVVTDAGSAKESIIAAARLALGDRLPRFVPGHPIAGTERSGVEASFAELFRGHRVVLTPLPDTAPDALERVRALWELTGAEVVEMDPSHHDAVLAATSHLPHVLAYALVDCLAGMDQGEQVFRYAAGGLRDFTRIAGSDPVMWRDICLANRQALLSVLDRFGQHLDRLAAFVAHGDGAALEALFTRARETRNKFARTLVGKGREDISPA
jgi:prephenate dehydrogenase